MIADRYHRILERVGVAANRAGRSPGDVTLIVATKSAPAEALRELASAGAENVGENYVQEGRLKREVLADLPLRWHFIGRLQRNKARQAGELFDTVHSIDSRGLAEALDNALDRPMPCLVQVNVGGERTKGGVSPGEVEDLCGFVASRAHLSLRGLMTLPPPASDRAMARRAFARLRDLRDRLRLPGVHLKELSMGMSADFEEAIAEGATMVRVGTAILGPRRR